MWIFNWKLIVSLAITIATARLSKHYTSSTIFRNEQIIFSSDFNISRVFVPADGSKYAIADSSEIPSVFFTVVDPNSDLDTCIYVLEDFAAYEVLDGGRDSTADYSFDKTVYFGAKDGLYKYEPGSLSAKKFGIFEDDIMQLQKLNGSDAFYILTAHNILYMIERNGTVKSHVHNVACATEFVLDTSNNIYFVSCNDHMINIVKPGDITSLTVPEDFREVKLLRPAFIMERCVPVFLDGTLHLLHVNGTVEKKDFHMKDMPTALSVDAALYLVAAFNGKLYEFNVMEVLLRSMFSMNTSWPRDMTEIVTSIMETGGDGLFGFYKLIHN